MLNSYLISTLLWVLVSPFLYGYHISALNQIQLTLQCDDVAELASGLSTFPVCIPMSDAVFGLVTSVFTIGGLVGSISSGSLMNRLGRKGAARMNALAIGLGSAVMMLAWSSWTLILGRFLVGVGSGIAMCVGPVFLAEIAPHNIKGSVGVLSQLSVVIGLLLSQAAGLFLSTPHSHQWRAVFLISAALCALQILFSAGVQDTPSWLTAVGRETEAKEVSARLWDGQIRSSNEMEQDVERAGLLAEPEGTEDASSASTSNTNIAPLTAAELFKVESLRRPVMAVLLAMVIQQVSGINAVMFYSNKILASVVPGKAGYISLGIAVLNVFMTFPAIYLIERLGRRGLLLGSIALVYICLVFIGIGINKGITMMSSIAILAFVGAFAVGLGPVPFVLIGEIVPFYATSATSSLALSLNWIINFIIGVGFLPLRDYLAGGEPGNKVGEGNVFFVFAVTFAVVSLVFARVWR